eukprot:COSAG02_NODE_430_length_22462_cov_52.755042_4_plen_104_part_00
MHAVRLAVRSYYDAGCTQILCTQPDDITGYNVTEAELSVTLGFDVTPVCATGYEGTPAVAACTAAGAYTLSGCTLPEEKASATTPVAAPLLALVCALVCALQR